MYDRVSLKPLVSIRDLASIIHARSNPWKVILVLRAYFDESGMHGSAPIVGVAGFIGTAEAWEAIERDWLAELDWLRDQNVIIPNFHATDCEAGEGFWESLPRPIREAYSKRLADVIAKQPGIQGVWNAVERSAWDAHAAPRFLDRFPHPYYLCAEDCLTQAADWSRAYADGSPIAIVFAESIGFSSNVNAIWGQYKASKRWANLSTFTTASPSSCVPLQCADMLSYESYRDWDLDIKAATWLDSLNARPAWQTLSKSGHLRFGGLYADEAMRNIVRVIEAGQPIKMPLASAAAW